MRNHNLSVLNIVLGMTAFGITGAGFVYLALLTLFGLNIIATVSPIPALVTGVTVSALVFSVHFSDSLWLHASESYAFYKENLLRAARAEQALKAIRDGKDEPEPVTPAEDDNYLETGIPINGGRDGYIITQRPLTLAERLWGEYLETFSLHCANLKSYKTKDLLGNVVSQPAELTRAKRFLHQMGLIYNVNGDTLGARPIRSFAYVVEAIPDRLSRVSFPDTAPPPIPPAPTASLEFLPKSLIKVKGQ